MLYLQLYKSQVSASEPGTGDFFSRNGFKVVEFSPGLKKLSFDGEERMKNFLWLLLSKGHYMIIYILDDANVVHTSYVIPRNIRFPFMRKGDLQIGPCYTSQNYRNKGIYTETLRYIIKRFYKNDRSMWIYTKLDNIASQKAIEKAGFTKIQKIRRSGLLRIMRIDKNPGNN